VRWMEYVEGGVVYGAEEGKVSGGGGGVEGGGEEWGEECGIGG